jgi:hypothetical protein
MNAIGSKVKAKRMGEGEIGTGVVLSEKGKMQCCGAGSGAARSLNFWPELEPVFASFGSGSN